MTEDSKQTSRASLPASLGSELYGWEIIRLIPDPGDNKKHVRCSMIVAARSIESVWEYLAADRADAATEIESIARFGPIIAVLHPPNIPVT